jgi:hypothetical protein
LPATHGDAAPPEGAADEDDADEPNDDEGEEEEEEQETAYRGIDMLVWLDVFNELSAILIDGYNEKDFDEFKHVIDGPSFEKACKTLSCKTTAKNVNDLATRCSVKVCGAKVDRIETLVLWKVGL